jgi:RNA-directed DNA polymerase
VAFDLDNSLSAIANEHGLKYSRYADDMHFSAKSEFDRTFAESVLKKALAAIRSQGFIASGAKTRIIGPSAQMKVLGLLVNGTELRIPPGARSYIERHIWAIGKFGLQNHATTAKFRDGTALIDHLQGKLNWAHCANPAWASRQRDALRRILESLPDRDFNGGVNRTGEDPEDWLFGRPFEWGDF